MQLALKSGLTHEEQTTVVVGNTAAAVGSGSLAVFSTPMMIALMEAAAANGVQPFLADGETTVGTMVNIRHLAATPVGMMVRAVARLDQVEGRRLLFTVEAFDGREKIGEGTHERFIIQAERFMAKAQQKA